MVGDMSKPLWILLASVGLVLLVAGANVANLFLVLVESRRRELAVRSALGASRARIARAFLAESFVLVLAGGLTGLLMAWGGIRLLVAYGPAALPRLHEVSVDGTVIAFAAGLILLAGVALGALPMVRCLAGHLWRCPWTQAGQHAGTPTLPCPSVADRRTGRHGPRAAHRLRSHAAECLAAARDRSRNKIEGLLTAGVSFGAHKIAHVR